MVQDDRASREWLAEEMGTTVERVKRWETGRERLPVNVVAALARWFEVPEEFLLGSDLLSADRAG